MSRGAFHHVGTSGSIFGPGYFSSEAIVLVQGAENGVAGYGLGGWTAEAADRVISGGPLVRGPHAYLYGKSLLLDQRGGTRRLNAEAQAQGLLVRAKSGDVLEAHGILWRLTLDPRRYPELTPLERPER